MLYTLLETKHRVVKFVLKQQSNSNSTQSSTEKKLQSFFPNRLKRIAPLIFFIFRWDLVQ